MRNTMIITSVLIVGVILILGLVAMCGCNDKIVEKNEEIVELNSWFFTSGIPNNAIKLKHPEENVKFELKADNGVFWIVDTQEYLQMATVNNGDTVYWHLADNDKQFEITYVDIIAKIDDNVVGYAVVKIFKDNNSSDYEAELLKSVVFPRVGGEYQQVTQDQVDERIQTAKD